jgi:ABC-2 type transport system permease protein
MNWRIVRTLVSKDLSLFFRKKGILVLTVMGLVFYLLIYFVMPADVNEDLKIGLYAPDVSPVFELAQYQEGVDITIVESEQALQAGVIDGTYIVGISLPADILDKLNSGERPDVNLYFTPDAPEEIREAMQVLVKELAYMQTGQTFNVEISTEILGEDMLGTPVPPRDRLRPLLAVFIIFMEILGLAHLISEEVERRTAEALLVTPVSVTGLFLAKSVTGIGLAFIQAVLFIAIVGGMNAQPVIVLLALLLGAAMATGISFLISSFARDFMSVLSWSIPALVILIVPTFNIMFPGSITGWIKAIPSFYLVDTIHRVANFGSGWGDIWTNLLILLGFTAVIMWAGIMLLRRKFL